MSKAATNASSSSEDDGNYSCNPQGIYDKDERLIHADHILLYMYFWNEFWPHQRIQKVAAEISKAQYSHNSPHSYMEA